ITRSSSSNNNKEGNKNTGRYPCTHCSKSFDFRFKLIEHMRIHTGEKPYSCSICQKTFRIAQSLRLHMVKRHNDQNTDINGDLSWTRPLEEIEENTGGPVSPHKHMSEEPKQNKERRRSKKNSRWQTMAPPGESLWRPRDERGGRPSMNNTRRVTNFGNRDPLRPQSNTQLLTLRHTNALSHPPASSGGNGRPYTCPYCTKCFTYPSHQRRHLLRHTGVRLHPCQFCEKSFLTPSELTVHTRTHTGERPFGCAQCGKRFARSGNLRAHQRDVHMGKRPFACTECGKRFAHRGNLRVHNHRVHQGDPYYMDDQQEPDIVPNPI
uniref:C2H2-type domain-containing protein n=1 Tax=Oreochromis niloticus TaxID=8128 RepID=A0A669DA37_ORENI